MASVREIAAQPSSDELGKQPERSNLNIRPRLSLQLEISSRGFLRTKAPTFPAQAG